MELKLKVCSDSKGNSYFIYGYVTLKNNLLLEFIEDENIGILKRDYESHYFPIKPNKYDVIFLDETDEQHKTFNAKINIKNSLPICFYVKLSPPEKQQLKWMNKQYWVQKPDNTWKFITYIATTILAIIGLLYTMSKS
jgi:hypothetical protein|tara:strand:+ start:3848 stop:4261 length:414 start_codon:yes stop_codon:yes gene_type:complete